MCIIKKAIFNISTIIKGPLRDLFPKFKWFTRLILLGNGTMVAFESVMTSFTTTKHNGHWIQVPWDATTSGTNRGGA